MVRISVRLDADLHMQLQRRAGGAGLPFSTFIRSVLEQAADPGGRYIYSSHDEILATCIQIFSILATSVGNRAPDTLARLTPQGFDPEPSTPQYVTQYVKSEVVRYGKLLKAMGVTTL